MAFSTLPWITPANLFIKTVAAELMVALRKRPRMVTGHAQFLHAEKDREDWEHWPQKQDYIKRDNKNWHNGGTIWRKLELLLCFPT